MNSQKKSQKEPEKNAQESKKQPEKKTQKKPQKVSKKQPQRQSDSESEVPRESAKKVQQATKPKVLQEADLASAPLAKEHQELISKHLRRINKVLDATDELAIGRYTSKQTAGRQIARMTVIFNNYMTRHVRGEFKGEEVESMVTDMVDASFYIGSSQQHSHSLPHIAPGNPLQQGSEQEYEEMMQALIAEDYNEVTELWNAPLAGDTLSPEAINVDAFGKDIGKDIGPSDYLRAYASADEPINRRPPNWKSRNREKVRQRLAQGRKEDLKRTWPPEEGDLATVKFHDLSDFEFSDGG